MLAADPEAITHAVVHGASSLSAVIAATTLVPGSDAVLIMPIQVAMVVCLAKIHGREVSSSLLRSAATASVGQILGKGLSRTLLRYAPGPGNLIRASVAGSVTEALGWAHGRGLPSSGGWTRGGRAREAGRGAGGMVRAWPTRETRL